VEPKIRVFELAKELSVDSKRVLEVLQTLNVDVKNHMSTVDEKTAEKVGEAVKRGPATKVEEVTTEAAKVPRATVAPKPVRDANPAKASLLDDFFGTSSKPHLRVEDLKRELRPTVATERKVTPVKAEATHLEAVNHAKPEVRVHEVPRTEAVKAESAVTGAKSDVSQPVAVTAEAPKVDRPPVESANVATTPHKLNAISSNAPEHVEVIVNVPVTSVEATEAAEGEAEGPSRSLPSGPAAGPARPMPAAQRPASGGLGLPRPAGSAPTSTLGLPSRPVPSDFEGPRRLPVVPSAPSGLGLPTKAVPGAAIGGPRPGAFGAPRPGGFAPRPGAGAPSGLGLPGQPGAAARARGGQLTIPKVDPKVAEAAKPAEGKRPIGQGGDRKKGDAFTKRETAASRPSEEKLFGRRRPSRQSSVVERRSLKPITIEGSMTVKDLAHEMGVTAAEVIKKLLTGFGIMATINQELDVDTSVLIGGEFGIDVAVKEVENVLDSYEIVNDTEEAEELRLSRHPVVTIMGHVDHGKTSLLDAIRSAKVATGEAGGITQHIGAYEVELRGKKITFLDTPGHEAFTAMRARGANVTDIAILVVAADDSVMPQTIESINHAKAANVPVIVAINKIDKPGAMPDKVKQDLTGYGLLSEEWGGETIMVPVSAKQQINLDLLLENILLLAEMLDLKANPEKQARGTVLEAELDKNRGPLATVLVQAGTLNNGDTFVAGTSWGRVRAMFDHRGRKLKSAGPSTPVQILGFQTVPAAGDVFRVAPDEKTARSIAEKRQVQVQSERSGSKAMSLDDFMSKVAEGEVKDLNLIIKSDVQGSAEALRGQLEKLRNDEVQVKIVHSAVGAITESDVMLASASKAIVIGFSVRPDDRAARAAADQGVDIRLYNVIYNVVDDIKAALTGMLAPKIEEFILGRAEVRETFKVPKVGLAAGCMVISGKVTRHAKYRLIRDGIVVWNGEINALRRFRDEVKDVAEGYECGITLEKYQDFKPGDLLEAFELKEAKAV
jgi:translation initiation factor IF-2